jgi:hypothetical protein
MNDDAMREWAKAWGVYIKIRRRILAELASEKRLRDLDRWMKSWSPGAYAAWIGQAPESFAGNGDSPQAS